MGKKTLRTFALLIIASLITATVTTGLCSGPLHTIFPNWIDSTSCLNYGGCIIGTDSASERDTGIFVMLFLAILLGVFLAVAKVITKWINRSENANK